MMGTLRTNLLKPNQQKTVNAFARLPEPKITHGAQLHTSRRRFYVISPCERFDD